MKMRWKAELPKMPRLPRVPPDAIQDIAPTQAARAEGSGEPAALGPLPAPSAYREKNPAEPPPADYKAPSIVAEHGGLALLFLGAAIASILGSISFKAAGKDHEALYLGQWVAPFLILGLYNKMVKQHGSDATSRANPQSY